jgi:DNA-binding IscR family transcriptional regulator
VSNELRERLAMSIMLLVATDFDQPGHGWREPSLAAKIGVPRHHLEPIIGALRQARLLAETTEQRLIPGKDLHRIQLCEILDAVRGSMNEALAAPPVSWNATIDALSQQINAAIQSVLADHSLADLLADDAPGPSDSSSSDR